MNRLTLYVVVCAILGLGVGCADRAPAEPSAPEITTVSPMSTIAGGAAFTLTVNGTGFSSSAAVNWNGTRLPTGFVSSTQLAAVVSANLVASAGAVTLTVSSESATSNEMSFAVTAAPIIAALNPAFATAGAAPFTLTVSGSGFGSGTVVIWNGIAVATTLVSTTQLTATIPASFIASAGSAMVIASGGGVTSNGVGFTINPPPVIAALTPTSATAGGPGFMLTLNGTGFGKSALAIWNASVLPTTVVSQTQLTAAIPAAFISTSGNAMVSVSSDGVTSNAAGFTVNPPPVMTALAPASAIAGTAAFTLTVEGAGFGSSTAVVWNGATLPTTFVSSSQLSATVSASLIASVGTPTVAVTSGGVTSNGLRFAVNAAPVLSALSPTFVTAGAATFTLMATGSGFGSTAGVLWNGAPLPTTFVGPTQLTAGVSASLVAAAGPAAVTVSSGGVTSNGVSFTINPPPVIAGLTPASASAGAAAFTATVNGSGFGAGATVQWNGAALPTTVVNSTQITVAVSASLIATRGTATVTVSSGGVTSNAVGFTINPPPVITGLAPASASAGAPTFAVTVNGTGFVASTNVLWNSSVLPTTFLSPSQLTAVVSTSLLAAPGSATVTVSTGGITSNSVAFTVNPPPVITGLAPNSATAGIPATTLLVNGTGFSSGAAIFWNRAAQTTTFVSPTQLTAVISADLVAAAGSATVTVSSGGGTSNSVTFLINPAPVITGLSPASATAGAAAFALAVNGTGFGPGATASWNGVALPTTLVNATQLTASVSAGLIVAAGTADVTVSSGGVTSNGMGFVVTAGPAIAGLTPSSATAGAAAFTVTVNGTGFGPGAAVLWNGSALPTNYVGSTQLTAAVSASLVATVGSASVTVMSGAVSSRTASFSISPPALAITSLSPNSANAGGSTFTITVNGTGFVSSSGVVWNGSALSTNFVSPTQVTASVPASLVATTGTASVTVTNAGGSVSNASSFSIAGWTTLATVTWEVDNHETLTINNDGSWSVTDAGGNQPFGIIVNGSPQTSGSNWAGFSHQAPFPAPGTVASLSDWNVQVISGQAPRCPVVGSGSNPSSTVSVTSSAGSSITILALDDGPCGSQGRVTFTLQISYRQLPATTGYVDPKYIVMGVTYAPPGPSANTFVQYQNSNMVGTTQSISNSFTNSTSVGVTLTNGDSIFGVAGGAISVGYSTMASAMTKSTSTVTTSFQVQQGEKTFGTSNSYFSPVNHDYDIVWIWLNPAAIFTVYNNGLVFWNGYGFDATDQPEMDIVGIELGYLNGDFGPMPPQFQASLARGWAAPQVWPAGQGPALSSAELAQIASADPFSDPTYGRIYIGSAPPSPETADHRFSLSICNGSASVPYNQAAPSASAGVYSCTLTYANQSIQAREIKNTFSETFSFDAKVGIGFLVKLNAELKVSNQLTWETDYQSSITNTATSTAQLSVQGPPCGNATPGQGPCIPVYDSAGNQPAQFLVYQDNRFGTFMFAPVHYTWP